MNELPQGISYFPPHENAPDFVIGTISINPNKFIEYLNTQPDVNGYIKFQILKSKAGKPYVKLDDFIPTKKAGNTQGTDF